MKTLKKIASFIIAFFSILTAIVFFRKRKDNGLIGTIKKAEGVKNDTREKLQKANAVDLVDNADNSNELHATTERIKEDTKNRIQDKIDEAGL